MSGPPADILLVEDDDGDVILAQEAFSACGVDIRWHVVADGDAALAFLRREGRYREAPRPALILLDLNLPGKDGREVLAEVKSDPVLKLIPVIVLTTSDAEHDIQGSYHAHANCYLVKPCDLGKFRDMARHVAGLWLSEARLPAA